MIDVDRLAEAVVLKLVEKGGDPDALAGYAYEVARAVEHEGRARPALPESWGWNSCADEPPTADRSVWATDGARKYVTWRDSSGVWVIRGGVLWEPRYWRELTKEERNV